MGKILWIGLMAGALAIPVAAADRTSPLALHCQHEDVKDCTAANGRIDAKRVAARNAFGFHTFGGPALPQEPLVILHEEYTRAGIEVGFNKGMEEAIDARRGRGYVRRVQDRIEARMKAAEARDKARAAGRGGR